MNFLKTKNSKYEITMIYKSRKLNDDFNLCVFQSQLKTNKILMKTNKIKVVRSLNKSSLDSIAGYSSINTGGSSGDSWTNERIKTGYSYTLHRYTDVSRKHGDEIKLITNKFDGNPFNNDPD